MSLAMPPTTWSTWQSTPSFTPSSRPESSQAGSWPPALSSLSQATSSATPPASKSEGGGVKEPVHAGVVEVVLEARRTLGVVGRRARVVVGLCEVATEAGVGAVRVKGEVEVVVSVGKVRVEDEVVGAASSIASVLSAGRSGTGSKSASARKSTKDRVSWKQYVEEGGEEVEVEAEGKVVEVGPEAGGGEEAVGVGAEGKVVQVSLEAWEGGEAVGVEVEGKVVDGQHARGSEASAGACASRRPRRGRPGGAARGRHAGGGAPAGHHRRSTAGRHQAGGAAPAGHQRASTAAAVHPELVSTARPVRHAAARSGGAGR
mmetsp:Transcript_6520/g.20978  ORF Transcript_6520/g.20978 Transcript_6520/m.20978 type:complete len:317 (-) Transcript_6520:177-1127(-)